MLAALSGGAMLGVPLLLLQTGPSALAIAAGEGGHRVTPGSAAAEAAGAAANGWQLANFDGTGATTTTAPPPTTTAAPATTTTAASPPTIAPHVAVATPPAPAAPSAVQVAAPARPTGAAVGVATWYSEAPAGYCASPWLPFGTVLTITNVANGARITCTVDDREANNPGRIVDLSTSGFSQIAPLSEGVVTVSVTW